ncbi:ABC transporter ATP-binding protein [Reyranella sp. CPCC 100927]|uniref:ABC transporter ATP-binding protein n=1 Tax=Reyranella sp. CPCC 100927 TaxID=2599616 RepID=UPI0011B556D7|nr:ABC transporter ATP-binding protein [Reyranella sp. CPCC 100927]TWT08686.1 ABC transporter ATP-binding protein [Reyranella sp. CPCC 100927]
MNGDLRSIDVGGAHLASSAGDGRTGQIAIEGLSKTFDGSTVVSDLDLLVRDGEFISLLGPSGCGKTTTLRCIAGLEQPSAGRIAIGADVVTDTRRDIFVPPNKRRLGMVFQSYALWPHMSVFGNIAYPLRLQKRPAGEIRKRVIDALALVGLDHLANRGVSELSGGQQQRTALARALASEPRVLLLDEPLSNLDASLRAHMRAELRRIHREIGTTAVYVTHDQLEAVTLSTRIAVMNQGRIQQIGAPREIFATPASRWVAEFVGFENFLDVEVLERSGDRARVRPRDWPITLMCRTASGDSTLRAGGRAILAVRSTAFQAGAGGDTDSVDGTLEDVVYMGEVTEFTVNAYGSRLRVRMIDPGSETHELEAGRPVTLRVSPHHAVALPCPA